MEVYRKEKKFILSYIEFKKCSNLFDKILIKDKHNNGDYGYIIRSLYFDTINDKDFTEKEDGVEVRRKIRLRIYDPEQDFAMLEMKQKTGENQLKRSIKISKEDAISLIHGNYSVLLKYNDDFASECYGVMSMQCYKPKSVVQYNRKAYIAKENNIRITFDFDIKVTEANFNIFDEKLNLYSAFNQDEVVLEVKYNNFLLTYIKDLLEKVEKSELSVSKYCLSREISKNYII